jgi:hypothetical protein
MNPTSAFGAPCALSKSQRARGIYGA